jgi:thiamine monophosphate synthase
VHLDDDALHPEAAREQARLLELEDFLIGVQVRNRADVARASAGTADYVLFGPVFSSPDDAEFGESLGVDSLGVVCADNWAPVLAAGGITPGNAVQIISSEAVRRLIEAAG